MVRSIFMFILIASFATSAFGQKDETLFGKSGLRFTGIWGGPSSNVTFLDGDNAHYTGGFGALEFNKTVLLGWGGYKLVNDVHLMNYPNDNVDMNYNGFILGYAPNASKVFHPRFSILTGSGKIKLSESNDDKIFVIQPAAGVEINVFRWARIGLEGGYRAILNTDLPNLDDKELSKFYGEVKFYFGISWGRHDQDDDL